MKRIAFTATFLVLLPSCGKKPCSQDTDCRQPEVCMSGVCMNIYSLDGIAEPGMDLDGFPDGLDGQEGDVTPPDGEEPPIDGAEPDYPASCTPSMTEVRIIMGSGVSSGENEHPEVITVMVQAPETDPYPQFYLLGRKLTGPSDYRLTTIRVLTNGSTGSIPVDLIGGMSELPDYHPLFPAGEKMGALFKDLTGIAGDRIVFITLKPGDRPSPFSALEPTDGGSFDATAADNGTSLFVVWRQLGMEPTYTINGGLFGYDGTTMASSELTIPEPVNVGEQELPKPAVAWGGGAGKYLVAYFYHGSGPEDPDKLKLVEIDEFGTSETQEEVELRNPLNHVVGQPVVVWMDDRWATLWQEARGGEGIPAHLNLTIKQPGGTSSTTMDNTTQWSPTISQFSQTQTGELDMVWTGEEIGILIKHDGGIAGKKIYFAEFQKEGFIIGQPLQVNPLESSSFFPSIAYMESASERYYLFAWIHYIISTGTYEIHTTTYGCTVGP